MGGQGGVPGVAPAISRKDELERKRKRKRHGIRAGIRPIDERMGIARP